MEIEVGVEISYKCLGQHSLITADYLFIAHSLTGYVIQILSFCLDFIIIIIIIIEQCMD